MPTPSLKLHVLGCALMFGACGLFGGPAQAGPAEDAARKGVELFEQKNYDTSAKAFERAAELKPDSARIQYDLGTALAHNKQYVEAADALSRALNYEDNPSPRDTHYNLGYTQVMDAQKPPEAKAPAAAPSAAGPPVAPQPEDLKTKIAGLKQGLESFRQAIIADAADEEAKFNYETTKLMIKKLEEEMKKQQQQNKDENQKDQNKDDKESKDQENQDKKNKDQNQKDKEGKEKQSDKDKQQDKQDQNKDQEKDQKDKSDEEKQNEKNEEKSEQDQKDGTEKKEQEQSKGLGATPTPAPAQPAQQGEPQPGAEQTPVSPEELDARRVLNSLAEEKPEQFKKLFKFKGSIGKNPLGRNW